MNFYFGKKYFKRYKYVLVKKYFLDNFLIIDLRMIFGLVFLVLLKLVFCFDNDIFIKENCLLFGNYEIV